MGLYDRVAPVVAYGFLLAVSAGVPAYAAFRVMGGDPLYGARTVTVTSTRVELYGVLPDIWHLATLWLCFILILPYAAASLRAGGRS